MIACPANHSQTTSHEFNCIRNLHCTLFYYWTSVTYAKIKMRGGGTVKDNTDKANKEKGPIYCWDGPKQLHTSGTTQTLYHPYLTSFSKSHLICQNTAMACTETTYEPINSFQLIWSKLNIYNNAYKHDLLRTNRVQTVHKKWIVPNHWFYIMWPSWSWNWSRSGVSKAQQA